MKKSFLTLTIIFALYLGTFIFCPKAQAQVQTDNIALLTKKGFFEHPASASTFSNPYEEVRKTLCMHLKYANTYNFDGLKSLYADNYVTSDGLNSDVYFELIKKTWASYPCIKYRMDIQNIEVNDNTAIAQVSEDAVAITSAKSGIINEQGILESCSNTVYYFEKINNEWLITSDRIISEKTFLKYGSVKQMQIDLQAPCQIPAGTKYTTALKINTPKDSLVIASIGQERITYPQSIAEEVFRKMPEDGPLERVFTANDKNINEYTVASFGITKAEINKNKEIKIYVTGLGFAMTRVNVIPRNDFVKVAENEQNK